MERAAREADYLRHAADELKKLRREDGEETALAGRRTTMMQGEKIASRSARGAGGGRRHAFAGRGIVGSRAPAGAPRAASAGADRARGEGDRRRDQRAGGGRPAPRRGAGAADFDPGELERIEERLFALRAASRKYSTPVDGLAALAEKYAADVALIDAGADQLKKLEAAAAKRDQRYSRGRDQTVRCAHQVAPKSSTRPSMPSWRR